MFCYSTVSVAIKGDRGGFDPLRCDATKCYVEHYKNKLTLEFIVMNGTIAEKKQAGLELEICERKMKYWARQPHFCKASALRKVEAENKKWIGAAV